MLLPWACNAVLGSTAPVVVVVVVVFVAVVAGEKLNGLLACSRT